MKKALRNSIGALAFLLSGCYAFTPFPAGMGDTPLEIMHWIHDNITYTTENSGHFQSSKETLKKRSGDCKHMAKLMEDSVEEICGINAREVLVRYSSGIGHEFVDLDSDDLWYDPMKDRTIKEGSVGEETTWAELWLDTYIR